MPKIFRVVVSSPGDVAAERDIVDVAASRLNSLLRDLNYDTQVVVVRWERDAWVGMDPGGTQKLIDKKLGIEESDLLIGIFWRRFGEKSVDGMTPTEHEIRLGYEAFLRQRTPQVLLYFRESGGQPGLEELQQLGSVLRFKEEFKSRGVYRSYQDFFEFDRSVFDHLLRYALIEPISSPTVNAVAPPDLQIDSEPRFLRGEGVAELLSDFVVKVPEAVVANTGNKSRRLDVHFFVTPSVMITSPLVSESSERPSTMRIVQVSGAGRTIVANAKMLGYDNAVFEDIELNSLGDTSKYQLRVENIRINASQLNVGLGASLPISGIVTFRDRRSGETLFVEQALLGVASGTSFGFDVEHPANNFSIPWISLPEEGIVFDPPRAHIPSLPCSFYIRFDEQVRGAFKSNDEEGHANGPSASCGTRFVVRFSGIPHGVRMFVSTRDLPIGNSDAILVVGSDLNGTNGSPVVNAPAAPFCVDSESGMPLKEMPIIGDSAWAVWEWTLPKDEASTTRVARFGVGLIRKSTEIHPCTIRVTGALGPLSTTSWAVAERSSLTAVPRFVNTEQSKPAIELVNTRTRLLFPFVTTLNGMDTGISISNISRDRSNAIAQTGLCSIHFYGWIDNVRIELEYPSPTIVGGEHFAWSLSSGGAVAATPGFQGYIIAQCDFPARGFATILNSDNRTTGGYLAEVLKDE